MGNRVDALKAALYTGSAVLALGLAGAAQAQDTALPEVVITAERTVQNLQTVPIAATILSGDDLAAQGVTRVNDLSRVAPSLSISTYNRSVFVNIRGIGIAQSSPTSTPGVAFYVDGAFNPHEFFIGGSFYDIESVEVLRGPQGTLTGQNSTGGAIYIRTPQPQFDELSGYVDLTAGDYDWMKAVVAMNLPLHDTLALRLAATRETRDSYTTNRGNSYSQPGNVNYTGYRAGLRWQPVESLDVNLRYEHFDSDTDYIPVKRRTDPNRDAFTIAEDADAFSIVKGSRKDIEVRWDFIDSLQLRWHSSFQDGLTQDMADGDRTNFIAPPTGRLGYADSYIDSKIHEVDLISTGDGPIRWVIGAFYMEDDVFTHLYRYQNTTVRPISAPTNTTITKAENRSTSAFGQVTWDITDQWQLIVGARYSEDEQTYARIVPLQPTGVAQSEQTTGRVALNYQWTPDTLIYASIARGYKAGGVNLVAGDAQYEPETNVVEELGVKTTVLDGRLRINGNIFASQYENLQLGSLLPSRLPSTRNVPESKSHGAELEVLGAFGDLRFNLGASYLEAETDSTASLLNNTVAPSVLVTVASGARLPFSPEWTINAGVEYDFHVLGGTLTPRLQWSHVEDQYANIFRNVNSFIPAYDVWDARLTYAPESERWQVEAFVNNLADETYVSNQLFDSSSADGGTLFGAPRTYGVRLLARFGGAEEAPPPPPPPPSPPPPPPPPPPPAYEAREFIAYFPFDQYVLTPEAQTVISQAADYAKGGNATRVVVVGHADTSGSAAYNVRLSERRAKATADALVASGIAQTALSVDWKGESMPAVNTGDGVKEPLNRRATIGINF